MIYIIYVENVYRVMVRNITYCADQKHKYGMALNEPFSILVFFSFMSTNACICNGESDAIASLLYAIVHLDFAAFTKFALITYIHRKLTKVLHQTLRYKWVLALEML